MLKNENEKAVLQRQIDEAENMYMLKQNKYLNYRKTSEQTELQTKKIDQEGKIIIGNINQKEKEILKVRESIRIIEDNYLALLSSQTTFKKGAQSTLQQVEKLKQLLRDKEADFSQTENDVARMRIDKLQTITRVKQFEDILSDLDKEIEEKDKLIEGYGAEIKRKHDDIERKQSQLDKLNKTFEKFTSGKEEENLGPLEATITNLSKAIADKVKEDAQLKKDWIRHQSEFVTLVSQYEELREMMKDINSKKTILHQKMLRLTGSSNAEKGEIRELDANVDLLRLDLDKLNKKIATNTKAQQLLINANFDLENEIMDRLKVREREAHNIESNARTLRESKIHLVSELIDVE